MFDFKSKEVLVIGLGGRGRAACEFLRGHGASVLAVDRANNEDLRDGKGTTAERIERVLTHNQRRTILSGHRARPVCSVVDGSKNLDFLVLGPLKTYLTGPHRFELAGEINGVQFKHAFLVGEAREKIRAVWSLFSPCTVLDSLVKAVSEAARHATSGDVVLLSPACSSLDQFRNYQERGEIFCRAVQSISRGVDHRHPNMNDKTEPKQDGE